MTGTAPATRLAALRLLTGAFALVYLVVRIPHTVDLTRLDPGHFDPVGVLGPLDEAPASGVVVAVLIAAIALGLAYTAGWHYRVTGPAFAVLLLALFTYDNSWGQIFHTEHLLALHVLIVGCTSAADAWSLDHRGEGPAGEDARYGWPVRLAAVVTVLTYVVTGIAKLRYAGLDWLTGDTLLHQVAFDNARKVVIGAPSSPFAGAVLEHPVLFGPMGTITLLVELGAPVALVSWRWAAIWSSAAWLFHVGILALMAIGFPYPLVGVAFAPLFRCERLVERVPGFRPSVAA